jgi:hypothetical protein
MDNHTGGQTEKYIETNSRITEKQAERQTDTQAERKTYMQAERQKDSRKDS